MFKARLKSLLFYNQQNNPEHISDEISSETDPEAEESDLSAKILQEEIEDYSEPDIDDEEKILIVDENEDGSIIIS